MMVLDVLLVTVGALGVVIAALSQQLRRFPVSEPLLGLVAGVVVGPAVLDLLSLPPLPEVHSEVHEGTRVLLALSVMAIALRYPLDAARSRLAPVALLVVVVMPAMALVATGLGWWVLGVPLATALLIGTATAPTDPVLASSVVTGDLAEADVPSRTRELLSLESGANDGLALPLVVGALAVAGPLTGAEAALESVWQVGSGTVLGAALGWVGGRALRAGEEHGAIETGPRLLFTLVLALAVLGASGLVHADGVLAVFVSGLVFNGVSSQSDRIDDLSIDEGLNSFAVLPLFIAFGAMLPWATWQELGWSVLALAVAVLLLRRLPLLLALARPLRLRLRDAVYLGWFGPIGVSALFYLTLEAKRYDVPPVVLGSVSLVVVLSTLAHGLTTAPGRRAYVRAAGGPQGTAAEG